jgi:hypothetical protein
MAIVFLKAIGQAQVIMVQDFTISMAGIFIDLNSLNTQSLAVLVQEFEEKRLYTDNVADLFLAAGEVLNAEGTGSAGPINTGGGTGGTFSGVDDVVRAEIGTRNTNYVDVFYNALLA